MDGGIHSHAYMMTNSIKVPFCASKFLTTVRGSKQIQIKMVRHVKRLYTTLIAQPKASLEIHHKIPFPMVHNIQRRLQIASDSKKAQVCSTTQSDPITVWKTGILEIINLGKYSWCCFTQWKTWKIPPSEHLLTSSRAIMGQRVLFGQVIKLMCPGQPTTVHWYSCTLQGFGDELDFEKFQPRSWSINKLFSEQLSLWPSVLAFTDSEWICSGLLVNSDLTEHF